MKDQLTKSDILNAIMEFEPDKTRRELSVLTVRELFKLLTTYMVDDITKDNQEDTQDNV